MRDRLIPLHFRSGRRSGRATASPAPLNLLGEGLGGREDRAALRAGPVEEFLRLVLSSVAPIWIMRRCGPERVGGGHEALVGRFRCGRARRAALAAGHGRFGANGGLPRPRRAYPCMQVCGVGRIRLLQAEVCSTPLGPVDQRRRGLAEPATGPRSPEVAPGVARRNQAVQAPRRLLAGATARPAVSIHTSRRIVWAVGSRRRQACG